MVHQAHLELAKFLLAFGTFAAFFASLALALCLVGLFSCFLKLLIVLRVKDIQIVVDDGLCCVLITSLGTRRLTAIIHVFLVCLIRGHASTSIPDLTYGGRAHKTQSIPARMQTWPGTSISLIHTQQEHAKTSVLASQALRIYEEMAKEQPIEGLRSRDLQEHMHFSSDDLLALLGIDYGLTQPFLLFQKLTFKLSKLLVGMLADAEEDLLKLLQVLYGSSHC